jgi:predicted dehydrogenase
VFVLHPRIPLALHHPFAHGSQKIPESLRLGILGCGPISQIAHFDAVKKARNVELHAICDLAPRICASAWHTLHQRPRVVVCKEYEAMLADPAMSTRS